MDKISEQLDDLNFSGEKSITKSFDADGNITKKKN